MTTATLSVLMATHRDESAKNLAASLESILGQTLRPRQIVIVLDGSVGDDQEAVISECSRKDRDVEFRLVRLAERGGLGAALNAGLKVCSFATVARMDSDDICMPHRFETQWRVLDGHRHIDVVGSWHAEFAENPGAINWVKTAPERHDDLVRALKWRTVLSHPTVMFRRELVTVVGGYDPLAGKLEDYDLFMRLVAAGARFHVIQEPLVLVRVTRGQRTRRGGLKLIPGDLRVRYNCYRRGTLTWAEFVFGSIMFTAFRLTPTPLKSLLYRLVRESPGRVPDSGSRLAAAAEASGTDASR